MSKPLTFFRKKFAPTMYFRFAHIFIRMRQNFENCSKSSPIRVTKHQILVNFLQKKALYFFFVEIRQ